MNHPDAINILVVEDEPDLCEAMVSYLNLEGFCAAGVGSATEAEHWLQDHAADILVLDVGLPDKDGISWIRQNEAMRGKGLIVTTARGELPDRVRGLTAGADAYLVKPVELEELCLIVNNISKRLGHVTSSVAAPWKFDPISWELITPDGQIIKLTRLETSLLGILANTPGTTVQRDVLISALGHMPDTYDPRRMEILVRRLRNKVRLQTQARLPLETVHGMGYAFTAQIEIVKHA